MTSRIEATALSIALLGALAFTPACGSTAGYYTTDAATVDAAERQVFGDLAAHHFGKRMQVQLPAKLAVVDVTGDTWNGVSDRRLVQAVEGLVEDDVTYTDVVSLSAGDGDVDPEGLRNQAAAHQADLELIVLRREEVHSNHHGLGILNVLIIPMFVVPTQSNDVHLTVCAMVRDVRNGLIYTTFDHHDERNVWSSFTGERADIRRTADALYTECVAKMRESLTRKLTSLERTSN